MDTKLTSSLDELEKLFSSRMCDYEEKLEKMSSVTGSPPDISSLAREFADFKSFVWKALSKLKSQIEFLSLGFDRHETAMRRKVLLIHGVPEAKNEKLHSVVERIIHDQMKLADVGKDFIHVCHRLGSSQRKSRPILVRLSNMEHRTLIWESKKLLKGSGITISEFLTHARHVTFVAARKHFGMKNCWSVEGKIVVITPDKTRHKIESSCELQNLIARFPSCTADCDEPGRAEEPESPKGTTGDTASRGRLKRRGRN